MSSATRRPRHYLRDHHDRAHCSSRLSRTYAATHPLLLVPLVIRYSPSSYVNAGHSLRSRLNDWALCGNPFTTKAVSSLREAADNRPGIIFARPYRNRGRFRERTGCGWSRDFVSPGTSPLSLFPVAKFRVGKNPMFTNIEQTQTFVSCPIKCENFQRNCKKPGIRFLRIRQPACDR